MGRQREEALFPRRRRALPRLMLGLEGLVGEWEHGVGEREDRVRGDDRREGQRQSRGQQLAIGSPPASPVLERLLLSPPRLVRLFVAIVVVVVVGEDGHGEGWCRGCEWRRD